MLLLRFDMMTGNFKGASMIYMRVVAWVAVILSVVWVVVAPSLESVIPGLFGVVTLGGLYLKNRSAKSASISQQQTVGRDGVGYQAAGDIKIGAAKDE